MTLLLALKLRCPCTQVPIHLTVMHNNLKLSIYFSLNTVMGHVHPLTFMLKHKYHCNSHSVVDKSTLQPEKSFLHWNRLFWLSPSDFWFTTSGSRNPKMWYAHLSLFFFLTSDFQFQVAKILKCGMLTLSFGFPLFDFQLSAFRGLIPGCRKPTILLNRFLFFHPSEF